MNFLQKYQASKHLTPDGVVGNKTAVVMMADFKIPSKTHLAHFLGQLKEESASFTATRENLNYSYPVLLSKFSKYFNQTTAQQYARKPEAIANRIYANRMGNGDEHSGDGWRYRGAGASQITGKATFQAYFESVNLPIWTDSGTVCLPEHYFKSAAWYWHENNVFRLCADTSIRSIVLVSKKINTGSENSKVTPFGLDSRIKFTQELFIGLGV